MSGPELENTPNPDAIRQNEEILAAFGGELPVVDRLNWQASTAVLRSADPSVPVRALLVAMHTEPGVQEPSVYLVTKGFVQNEQVHLPDQSANTSVLAFTPAEWWAFLQGVRAGEFNFDTDEQNATPGSDEPTDASRQRPGTTMFVDTERRLTFSAAPAATQRALGAGALSADKLAS